MPLNQKNFDEIEDLLVPYLDTPTRREIAVLKIFLGTNKQPPHLDYTGDTREACFWIVKALFDYGEIEPHLPALWNLLEYIKQFYTEPTLSRICELQELTLEHSPHNNRYSKSKAEFLHEEATPIQSGRWGNLTNAQAIIITATLVSLVTVAALVVLLNPYTVAETNTPVPEFVSSIATEIVATERSAVLALAETGVSSNTEWTPYVTEFDNVQMVLVPKGCFMMGSTNGDDDEQPVNEVCFDEPFWIDRYEVSNIQYGSIGCESVSAEPTQPRNCVSWLDAGIFCRSRAARLPTEAEWEYAARGPSNYVYPWGNSYLSENVIGEDNITDSTQKSASVGSRPDGVSWVGAYDLSGNMWEWTNSIYESYPYDANDGREINTGRRRMDVRRVLRGGSFNDDAVELRSTNRIWSYPQNEGLLYGFRCVRSAYR